MTRPREKPSAPVLSALAFAGALLTACAVALAVDGAAPDRAATAAILHGSLVAVPVTVGLLVLRRSGTDRFAWLLVAAGMGFSLTALAESDAAVPYAIGRSAVWLVEPVLAYLVLAFPSGRLTTRLERRLMGAIAAVVALLYLPSALLSAQYPTPSPYASCDTDCPANAFALVGTTPDIVAYGVRPLREVLTVLIFAAVAAVVTRRMRRAGPLLRVALAPVAATAWYRAAALAAFFVARAAGDGGEAADVVAWLWAMSLPAIALAFGAGLINRRLHAANAFTRLALALRTRATGSAVRDALADALEDPSLELVRSSSRVPGGWADESGTPVGEPAAGRGRKLTRVRGDGDRVVGVVITDADLGQDEAVIRTAASYAFAAAENVRLVGELRTAVAELAESRIRVIASGDAARRDIERDLHDGAQQQLIALRMRLGLASEDLERDAPAAAARMAALGDELDEAIGEVRRLARGVYPSLLTSYGLERALTAAVRGSPVRAVVRADGVGRLRPDLERALYFACIEGLQNAVRHARGASYVDISLASVNGDVTFEVRDDGPGFDVDRTAAGAGLANLADRLAAVGGVLSIDSSPGHGTRVTGRVPVEDGTRA